MGKPPKTKKKSTYKFKTADKVELNQSLGEVTSLTRELRTQLSEPAEAVPSIESECEALGLDPKCTTIGSVITLAALSQAAKGNNRAFKTILEAIESKNSISKQELNDIASEIVVIISREITDTSIRKVISDQILDILPQDM